VTGCKHHVAPHLLWCEVRGQCWKRSERHCLWALSPTLRLVQEVRETAPRGVRPAHVVVSPCVACCPSLLDAKPHEFVVRLVTSYTAHNRVSKAIVCVCVCVCVCGVCVGVCVFVCVGPLLLTAGLRPTMHCLLLLGRPLLLTAGPRYTTAAHC